jgi:alkanesulfonate monooxygenase SsuD/methylene tetrahydromethanopterin reductase-like flavin-dependent oxidoreductase (luciferase family)
MKSEFRALGVDFDVRKHPVRPVAGGHEAGLAWAGQPMTFEGLGVSARGVTPYPPSVQRPHPPLWFRGEQSTHLTRVVAHNAGWMPLPNPPSTARHLRSPALESLDDLAQLLDRVRDLAASSGRTDPINVMYWLPPAAEPAAMKQHVAMANQTQELGVNSVVVNGEGDTVNEARAFVARYQEHVLQHLETAGHAVRDHLNPI